MSSATAMEKHVGGVAEYRYTIHTYHILASNTLHSVVYQREEQTKILLWSGKVLYGVSVISII